MALTPRKATFAAEYQKDLNATQAAIRAGYSEKTAASQGSRLLKDVEVQQALQKATSTAVQVVEKRLDEAAGSAAWIIAESVRVVQECENPKDRVPALALLAKRFPEFRDAPAVDNSQHLHLPPGTTLADLLALRDGLKQ